MANNAFNFKGLYDKVAGLLKNSAIVPIGDYIPDQDDYVAVYKNVPGSAGTADSTIAIKEYVSVTDIGSGSGPLPDNVMESFTVIGAGGVVVNVDGGEYTEGPVIISNNSELGVSATLVPSGLNWEGPYSSSTEYQLNDVVSNVDPTSGLYSTWLYINDTPATGQALPTAPATYNTYWAQLGTQGPPGNAGPAGQPSATATFGFKPVTQGGGAYTSINVSGTPGSGSNDVGKIFLVNNTSTTNPLTELVFTINAGLSGGDPAISGAGWPWNSQITVMNVSVENPTTGMPPVKIVGGSGVTIYSADGAQYLRTQYSTCSIVRRSANEYYMFGDLTNIS